jgi:hypothetical protein
MESCFGTLKTELLHQACYKTHDPPSRRHYLRPPTIERKVRYPLGPRAGVSSNDWSARTRAQPYDD